MKTAPFFLTLVLFSSFLLLLPGASEKEQRVPVTLPNGKVIRAELADTPEKRETGLMGRPHLERGSGMLFIFPTPGRYPFWMKKTLISLDILWLDAAHRIVHIEEGLPPCHQDPCPQYGPPAKAVFVLELPGGTVRAEDLHIGNTLQFELRR